MKALVLTAAKTLQIQELPDPIPNQDEVVIDVKACGVCGTDVHMFQGGKGAFENQFPLIMGHEFSGVVSAVGSAVSGLKIGDKVCVDPNLYCGNCPPCREGRVHFCEHMTGYGTTHYGAMAEKCLLHQRAVYKVPDHLPFEFAALVEPLACCLHGIDRSNIKPGQTVAVIGAGSIGQIMIQLALLSGAAKVIAFDLDQSKCEKAVKLGAAAAYASSPEGIAAFKAATKGESISSVIECVGRPVTMELALDLASPSATVMLFGLCPPNTAISVYPYEQIFLKELTVTASYINPLVSNRVIDIISNAKVDLSEVITDRIPLADSIQIFENPAFRSHGKIIIQP